MLTWKRNSEGGTPPNYWIYGPTGTGKLYYFLLLNVSFINYLREDFQSLETSW